MLKISVIDDSRWRRLIVEGKLIPPWTAELRRECIAAKTDLHGRQLVVDLKSVAAISPEGEDLLLQLMNENVEFQCGVFMKEVLRQVGRKRQRTSDQNSQ